jgi:hypothetical protein
VATPDPIGPISFSEPRAVQVRSPKKVSDIHSAVSGMVNIYTDTKIEAEAIIAAWPVIMQKAADQAQEILDEIRRMQISESTMNRYRGDADDSMKTGQ